MNNADLIKLACHDIQNRAYNIYYANFELNLSVSAEPLNIGSSFEMIMAKKSIVGVVLDCLMSVAETIWMIVIMLLVFFVLITSVMVWALVAIQFKENTVLVAGIGSLIKIIQAFIIYLVLGFVVLMIRRIMGRDHGKKETS